MDMDIPTYDLDINVGVPGWQMGGRMVRLVDVVEATGDTGHITTHRHALALLEIAYRKMADELQEVEG